MAVNLLKSLMALVLVFPLLSDSYSQLLKGKHIKRNWAREYRTP